MTRSRVIAGLAAVAAAAGTTAMVPAAAAERASGVAWRTCPNYSGETLKRLAPPEQQAELRKLLARMECGTVSVPLDYRQPSGRQITIAVTRLKATDRGHRLGSLAVNPGGPGGSGYLMPIQLVLDHENGTGAKVNQRYDLIGFDPRGVGYSTKVNCPKAGRGPELGSPVTEAAAKAAYDWTVQTNKACGDYDPAFLGRLTTANVARDLDRVSAGLGEKKLSFLGISWGTWLGALYRNLYPNRVQLMWLDSTAIPDFRLDAFQDGRSRATTLDWGRFAAWMGARDGTYGFGSTQREVQSSIAAMKQEFVAHPKTFSDLPDVTFDGFLMSQIAAQPSLNWPLSAGLLKELQTAKSGEPAPPLVKEVFSGGSDDGGEPPADLPEQFNPTMNHAVFCNEDTGPRDFATFWAAYQKGVKRDPVTGELRQPLNDCAGWPLPAQPVRLRHSDAPLVMSAHRYEVPSPYPWSLQMRAAVGGSVLTVDDDIHGSVAGMPSDCAPRIAAYFASGKPDNGECQGVPVPTSTSTSADALKSSTSKPSDLGRSLIKSRSTRPAAPGQA
ncbi:alpha/beta fold hydrolase [Actinomadura barringtoniae]|uniref:Alpha/beta fold hydrolase n=1 Tax=Actinomadura barringtoniae TaxID=1427535 RepID=A0A939PQV5_9ACTN|nr:alpha/beta fold hydrolase [Actinomadura barringtoniae]MBO2453076.1 alpha/beta fold hydrolase [Actinomadura barringtoniae]